VGLRAPSSVGVVVRADASEDHPFAAYYHHDFSLPVLVSFRTLATSQGSSHAPRTRRARAPQRRSSSEQSPTPTVSFPTSGSRPSYLRCGFRAVEMPDHGRREAEPSEHPRRRKAMGSSAELCRTRSRRRLRRRWPGVSARLSLDEARLAHAGPHLPSPPVNSVTSGWAGVGLSHGRIIRRSEKRNRPEAAEGFESAAFRLPRAYRL
jgi:hypothetical protein